MSLKLHHYWVWPSRCTSIVDDVCLAINFNSSYGHHHYLYTYSNHEHAYKQQLADLYRVVMINHDIHISWYMYYYSYIIYNRVVVTHCHNRMLVFMPLHGVSNNYNSRLYRVYTCIASTIYTIATVWRDRYSCLLIVWFTVLMCKLI